MRRVPTIRATSWFSDNLKAALPPGTEAFFTTVAPASTGYNARNEYYSSDREYIYAIADALKQEYHAVSDAGLLLQVDDAVLANMYDYLVQQSPDRYREWAQLRVEALNHALEGIPENRVRYHVCFGSWHVPHVADAPLEAIIDLRLVADRIIRFANLVGKENVMAGTDCGFAQNQGIQRLHPSVMWAKFESLVEGARLASQELWG